MFQASVNQTTRHPLTSLERKEKYRRKWKRSPSKRSGWSRSLTDLCFYPLQILLWKLIKVLRTKTAISVNSQQAFWSSLLGWPQFVVFYSQMEVVEDTFCSIVPLYQPLAKMRHGAWALGSGNWGQVGHWKYTGLSMRGLGQLGSGSSLSSVSKVSSRSFSSTPSASHTELWLFPMVP